MEHKDRYVIPSLDRAIQVLGVLGHAPQGMSLADMARHTSIPKSTLFRVLVTLQKHHCVALSPDGRTFRLGSHLWELGSRFADQSDLFRVSEPYMTSLANECGETVFLSKLEDGEVVYLRRIESPKSVAAVRKLESRAPVHCTATGRALIAWLPTKEVESILDQHGTKPYNAATVTDRAKLNSLLEDVRGKEYAVVDGEFNSELLCVSAPVLDHQRRPSAALTVAMLSAQVSDRSTVAAVGYAVRSAAQSLSRELGGAPSRSSPAALEPAAS